MDVFQAVSGYVTKMVSTGDGQAGSNAAKMKILLLDSETVSPVSPYISIAAY
jgi:vacuolar protein sorting-associated protein 45